jgi:hypothetical protein
MATAVKIDIPSWTLSQNVPLFPKYSHAHPTKLTATKNPSSTAMRTGAAPAPTIT